MTFEKDARVKWNQTHKEHQPLRYGRIITGLSGGNEHLIKPEDGRQETVIVRTTNLKPA